MSDFKQTLIGKLEKRLKYLLVENGEGKITNMRVLAEDLAFIIGEQQGEIPLLDKALANAAEILANFKGEPDSTKMEEWQACYAKLFTQMAELAATKRESSVDDLLSAAVGLSKSCSGRLPTDSSDSVSLEAIHVMRLNKALADYMAEELNSIEGDQS